MFTVKVLDRLESRTFRWSLFSNVMCFRRSDQWTFHPDRSMAAMKVSRDTAFSRASITAWKHSTK